MASAFLPLVFSNLPPVIRSHHIWTTLWGGSILVFFFRVLQRKLMLMIIAYALLVLIGLNLFWNQMDEWNKNMLYRELYAIAVGASIITYFNITRDYYSLARITFFTLICVLITAVMTIFTAAINPMYARNLAAGLGSFNSLSEVEQAQSILKYGGATYGMAHAFIGPLAMLIFYYKNSRLLTIKKKYILVFIILIYVALFSIQFIANIYIGVAVGVFALLNVKKGVGYFIVSFIIIILMLIPQNFYIDALYFLGELFNKNSEIHAKFIDTAAFFDTGAHVVNAETGLGSRANRYNILWEAFQRNPLMGCYFFSTEIKSGYNGAGAHLHWMNKLTITGIFGLFVFIAPIIYNIRSMVKSIAHQYKFFFLTAVVSILALGFMKPIWSREAWYMFFILIPGMCYLPLIYGRKKRMNINVKRPLSEKIDSENE